MIVRLTPASEAGTHGTVRESADQGHRRDPSRTQGGEDLVRSPRAARPRRSRAGRAESSCSPATVSTSTAWPGHRPGPSARRRRSSGSAGSAAARRAEELRRSRRASAEEAPASRDHAGDHRAEHRGRIHAAANSENIRRRARAASATSTIARRRRPSARPSADGIDIARRRELGGANVTMPRRSGGMGPPAVRPQAGHRQRDEVLRPVGGATPNAPTRRARAPSTVGGLTARASKAPSVTRATAPSARGRCGPRNRLADVVGAGVGERVGGSGSRCGCGRHGDDAASSSSPRGQPPARPRSRRTGEGTTLGRPRGGTAGKRSGSPPAPG